MRVLANPEPLLPSLSMFGGKGGEAVSPSKLSTKHCCRANELATNCQGLLLLTR